MPVLPMKVLPNISSLLTEWYKDSSLHNLPMNKCMAHHCIFMDLDSELTIEEIIKLYFRNLEFGQWMIYNQWNCIYTYTFFFFFARVNDHGRQNPLESLKAEKVYVSRKRLVYREKWLRKLTVWREADPHWHTLLWMMGSRSRSLTFHYMIFHLFCWYHKIMYYLCPSICQWHSDVCNLKALIRVSLLNASSSMYCSP